LVKWVIITSLFHVLRRSVACIVVVMKGPAYVADPYPLEDSEYPDSPGRHGIDVRN
jgi:hypothetical protein